MTAQGEHQAVPEPGTELAAPTGLKADMGNEAHYPVQAECLECHDKIIMRRIRGEWLHWDDYLEVIAS